MEFLLYLTPIGNQILNKMISAKFHIYENSGPCLTKEIFGYTDYPNKFYICTNRIKSYGHDPYVMVNETLQHEAIHASQFCRQKKTFGLWSTIGPSKKNMILSDRKRKEIEMSINMSKNTSAYNQEYEAFYFEDKPKEVLNYVKKFCF